MTAAESSGTRCTPCGTEFEVGQSACPACGSADRTVGAVDAATLRVHAGFRGKARYGQPGEIAWHREQRNEVVWRVDRDRWERFIRIVDKENDHYLEEWRELESGEVAFRKEGKLSDPGLHGESGKRAWRPPAAPDSGSTPGSA